MNIPEHRNHDLMRARALANGMTLAAFEALWRQIEGLWWQTAWQIVQIELRRFQRVRT